MVRERCTASRANGQPCRAFALPGEGVCWSHLPGNAEAVKQAQRRGGENRSAARRAAKLWAATGNAVNQDDLPAMLRAAILDVRVGKIEPSVASAIATLAKTSVSLAHDLELEGRIAALEAVIERRDTPKIRRIR